MNELLRTREGDRKEVAAFRTLRNLNVLSQMIGYGFSSVRFGNMSVTWARRQGQDPERVSENQKRFAQAAGFDPEGMVKINPEAGNKVLVVGKEDCGEEMPAADALITTDREVSLVLMPSDCTPIIITNKKGEFTAMVHAGREGTKAEIAKGAVKKLVELGFDPGDFVVGIGPSVECYSSPSFATDDPDRWLPHLYVTKVDGKEDVEFKVVDNDTNFSGRYKIETFPHRDLFVDITGCNVAQLIEAGIPKESVETSGVCTVCNATLGRMYSHGYSVKEGKPIARILAYTVLK